MILQHRLVIIAAAILLSACTSKPTENATVHDPAFVQALANKRIVVIAPASAVEPEELERLKALKQFNIVIPDNLQDISNVYHAHNDKQRLAFLKEALTSSSKNDIIWALRGGYGSARLIAELKKIPKPKQEKLLIGYSDITALHLFLSQDWGWKTIQGPVLNEFLNPRRDPENLKRLGQLISGQVKTTELTDLIPLNAAAQAVHSKPITGKLTGGNITLVLSSIGTTWQIQTAGKILFLEDHKVEGYKLDRELHHLKEAGLLKNVKAIILGDLKPRENTGLPDKIEYAVNRFANETKIPVFKSEQFGHGPVNYPMVYNAESTIAKANTHFSLTMKVN